MKVILLFILALPCLCFGQKNNHGFASIGVEGFLTDGFGNHPGIGGALGTSFGTHFALGFDLAAFFKDTKFGEVHGDITTWLNGINKPIAAFIAYNPGATLYKKSVRVGGTTVETKGGFAYDIMGGVKFLAKGRNDGALFSMGYSQVSFSSPGLKQRYGGLKVKLCYAIGK